MTETQSTEQALERPVTLLEKLGAKYLPGTPTNEVANILNATAFKTKDGPPSPAQVAALLVVADQYGLNPWTREIYAFPDRQNGIVPVVGIDGWNRIANEHPAYAGETVEVPPREEWVQIDPDAKLAPPWMRVLVYRSDRKFPTDHTEYLDECYRPAFKTASGQKIKGPWQTHTKRMLEHKARIQARRVAFGFSGIYDEDEAERVVSTSYDIEGSAVEVDLLGHEGWQKLVAEAASLGYSAQEVVASAATAGYEGPPEEMPRDLAERLFRAMRSASRAEQPRNAGHVAEDGPADAETAPEPSTASDAAVDVSEADDEDAADEEFLAATDRDAKDKATRAQLNLIAAIIKRAKLPEDEWRGYMQSVTGKTSRSDLTKSEASAFIDFLSESGSGKQAS